MVVYGKMFQLNSVVCIDMAYECVLSSEVNIFHKPSRIILSSFSGGGKSWLCSQLIRKYKELFDRIICVGSRLENLEDVKIEYHDFYDPFEQELTGKTLIVWDDLVFNKPQMKIIANSYIKSRHLNISNIFLVQSLFVADPLYRIISSNANYFILLKSRDRVQIARFASTFLPKHKVEKFVRLHTKLTTENKFGYIVVDFNKDFENDPLALRMNIANEGNERSFLL